MNRPLPRDFTRCMGMRTADAASTDATWCPKRETCQRYLQRNDLGPRTPVAMWVCNGGKFERRIGGEA